MALFLILFEDHLHLDFIINFLDYLQILVLMLDAACDCGADGGFNFVTRKHPNADSSIPEIFNSFNHLVLKLILDASDTQHLHIVLFRSVR